MKQFQWQVKQLVQKYVLNSSVWSQNRVILHCHFLNVATGTGAAVEAKEWNSCLLIKRLWVQIKTHRVLGFILSSNLLSKVSLSWFHREVQKYKFSLKQILSWAACGQIRARNYQWIYLLLFASNEMWAYLNRKPGCNGSQLTKAWKIREVFFLVCLWDSFPFGFPSSVLPVLGRNVADVVLGHNLWRNQMKHHSQWYSGSIRIHHILIHRQIVALNPDEKHSFGTVENYYSSKHSLAASRLNLM